LWRRRDCTSANRPPTAALGFAVIIFRMKAVRTIIANKPITR
jgi:hypothetical protein